MEPWPLHWEPGVIGTGPPWKSLQFFLIQIVSQGRSVQTQKPHISIPETPHYVNALYYLYWTTIRMSTTLEHTSEIISNSSWYCLSFPCRHSSSNHIQNVLNSVICLKSHLRALSFNPAYFAWSKEKKDRQWMMKVNGIKFSILKFDL